MAHSHGSTGTAHGGAAPGEPVEFGRGVRLGVGAVLLLLLAATLAGLVLLWPTGESRADPDLGLGGAQVRGTVAELERGPCPGLGEEAGAPAEAGAPVEECATVTVTIDDGPDAGEVVVLTQAQGASSPRIEEGAGLVLARAPDLPLESRYQVVDLQRGPSLLALAGLFALAVVVVGRWRGLAALVGLAATFVLLTLFVLPALLEGRDPLQVAVVGSAAIMFVSLYLAHGVSVRTTVALLGTLVSLVLTGALAAVFVAVGEFSGLVSEEAIFLSAASSAIDLRGLLLAGIVIGALGVLDDVTVTQTSAVFELHAANPALGRGRLAAGAMRIGRDHIASTVNTLVLAYAGASLPLLLLFVLAAQPVTDTLTNEVVAQEVVRTLVGGLGIVASVPLTTALAVLVAPRARVRRDVEGSPAAGEPQRGGSEIVPGFAADARDDPAGPQTAQPVPAQPVHGRPVADEPVADGSLPERIAPEEPAPEGVPPDEPPPAGTAPSRWRRGSRRLRAERDAEELLRGLRPTDPPP